MEIGGGAMVEREIEGRQVLHSRRANSGGFPEV